VESDEELDANISEEVSGTESRSLFVRVFYGFGVIFGWVGLGLSRILLTAVHVVSQLAHHVLFTFTDTFARYRDSVKLLREKTHLSGDASFSGLIAHAKERVKDGTNKYRVYGLLPVNFFIVGIIELLLFLPTAAVLSVFYAVIVLPARLLFGGIRTLIGAVMLEDPDPQAEPLELSWDLSSVYHQLSDRLANSNKPRWILPVGLTIIVVILALLGGVAAVLFLPVNLPLVGVFFMGVGTALAGCGAIWSVHGVFFKRGVAKDANNVTVLAVLSLVVGAAFLITAIVLTPVGLPVVGFLFAEGGSFAALSTGLSVALIGIASALGTFLGSAVLYAVMRIMTTGVMRLSWLLAPPPDRRRRRRRRFFDSDSPISTWRNANLQSKGMLGTVLDFSVQHRYRHEYHSASSYEVVANLSIVQKFSMALGEIYLPLAGIVAVALLITAAVLTPAALPVIGVFFAKGAALGAGVVPTWLSVIGIGLAGGVVTFVGGVILEGLRQFVFSPIQTVLSFLSREINIGLYGLGEIWNNNNKVASSEQMQPNRKKRLKRRRVISSDSDSDSEQNKRVTTGEQDAFFSACSDENIARLEVLWDASASPAIIVGYINNTALDPRGICVLQGAAVDCKPDVVWWIVSKWEEFLDTYPKYKHLYHAQLFNVLVALSQTSGGLEEQERRTLTLKLLTYHIAEASAFEDGTPQTPNNRGTIDNLYIMEESFVLGVHQTKLMDRLITLSVVSGFTGYFADYLRKNNAALSNKTLLAFFGALHSNTASKWEGVASEWRPSSVSAIRRILAPLQTLIDERACSIDDWREYLTEYKDEQGRLALACAVRMGSVANAEWLSSQWERVLKNSDHTVKEAFLLQLRKVAEDTVLLQLRKVAEDTVLLQLQQVAEDTVGSDAQDEQTECLVLFFRVAAACVTPDQYNEMRQGIKDTLIEKEGKRVSERRKESIDDFCSKIELLLQEVQNQQADQQRQGDLKHTYANGAFQPENPWDDGEESDNDEDEHHDSFFTQKVTQLSSVLEKIAAQLENDTFKSNLPLLSSINAVLKQAEQAPTAHTLDLLDACLSLKGMCEILISDGTFDYSSLIEKAVEKCERLLGIENNAQEKQNEDNRELFNAT